ncbi:GNAT family N-acetyltransferase [Brevibacillus humidisoli]|uniref:GNAT family N-acetyltransferase n=1 Tax=Brevibacillus humidisoli TaxID=2895522 RepID=UPI001E63D7DA|nr:GNAT family N-acetyltransferase [Brevibacillus humidisoli]UFJ41074.1 GNAT family N-acetyltransferase [Brevibacillus humidisoli]
MSGDTKLIRLIEELAANGWPAYIQQTLGAWRLRANMDVTKRANSVYTSGPFPEHGEWLDIVEDFYRRRSLSPCFHISETSPAELDGILDSAGYRKDSACFTMVASCGEVMDRSVESDLFTSEFAGEASSEWIHAFIRLEGYSPGRYEGYVHIFSMIGPKKAFVILREHGELIALGTAVVERGWAGLSNIVVAPEHRGKGAAIALLRSLADWSLRNGADQLYLQVLKDNSPALSLYRKMGFTPLYEYHYRLLDT